MDIFKVRSKWNFLHFPGAMRKQSAQKRCIWIVLALFSAIAVMGNGLHFVPGLGHECGETHRPLAAQGGCHSSDCAKESAHFAADHRNNSPVVSVALKSDTCPVCQFFTQAKSVPLTVAFEIDSRVAEGRISTIHPLLADRVPGVYNSRAPPSCG
jgi:hypothetical protein